MKGADKLLAAIIIGVLLTVVAAVVIVVRRPPPSYREDNTAENIVHNYLLALEQQDYVRAYGYISPSLDSYPSSVDRFIEQVRGNKYAFPLDDDSITLEIDSSRNIGASDDLMQVSVRQTTFSRGGLFGSSQYSSLYDVQVKRENGAWKIRRSDRYFLSCWTQAAGCK